MCKAKAWEREPWPQPCSEHPASLSFFLFFSEWTFTSGLNNYSILFHQACLAPLLLSSNASFKSTGPAHILNTRKRLKYVKSETQKHTNKAVFVTFKSISYFLKPGTAAGESGSHFHCLDIYFTCILKYHGLAYEMAQLVKMLCYWAWKPGFNA